MTILETLIIIKQTQALTKDKLNNNADEIWKSAIKLRGKFKAVVQAIGNLTWNDTTDFTLEGSLVNFLGKKMFTEVIPKQVVNG